MSTRTRPITPNQFADDPTRPIPHETLAEVSEKWRAAQEAGVPVLSCDKPTKNIKTPRK